MSSQRPAPKNRSGLGRQAALAMELPFLLVGGTIVGGLIGYFLDRSFHTKPWLMFALGAAGFAVGVRDLLRRLASEDKNGPGSHQQ
jgi:F0F1-type ATP synthase assembly protein I